mmetsp:Transcript_49389/g.123860  ORF Transcript_49389/g.123860 Transcript_49389/m.123860 type:complete len:200 (+) Transcript_49389:816-1415(+)
MAHLPVRHSRRRRMDIESQLHPAPLQSPEEDARVGDNERHPRGLPRELGGDRVDGQRHQTEGFGQGERDHGQGGLPRLAAQQGRAPLLRAILRQPTAGQTQKPSQRNRPPQQTISSVQLLEAAPARGPFSVGDDAHRRQRLLLARPQRDRLPRLHSAAAFPQRRQRKQRHSQEKRNPRPQGCELWRVGCGDWPRADPCV